MTSNYSPRRSPEIHDVDDPVLDMGDLRPAPAIRAKQYTLTLASQFAALPMAIFNDLRAGKLTYRDVCVHCYLIVKQGKNQSSYWTIDGLSLLTGIAPTGVKQSIRRLLAAGHIQRKRVGGRAHTVCATRVQHGKGKEGIFIKGYSPTEFLVKEPMAFVKKSTAGCRATIKPRASRLDASRTNGNLPDGDAMEEPDFDIFCKPQESLCPPSKEDYYRALAWGPKPDVYLASIQARKVSRKNN